MKYQTIYSFDDMATPGIYIVSFWNSDDFKSQIHTVTVNVKDATQDPIAYNTKYWNDNVNSKRIFITGYKVSRK